jgi:hypothetical protein
MKKMLCFDLDGTIADLYSVENWLSMLRAENPIPYEVAEPIYNMNQLNEVLHTLIKEGWDIRVITWLSKNSSESYKKAVRKAKKEWLERYNFPYSHFHGVAYGATKADSVRKYLGEKDTAILIDDNAKVRNGWHLGETINPTDGKLIEKLFQLI